MTNTGGDQRGQWLSRFHCGPRSRGSFCAGRMGSRTQIPYLAALGLSPGSSHFTGGEVRHVSEMAVLSLGICVPDFAHLDTVEAFLEVIFWCVHFN